MSTTKPSKRLLLHSAIYTATTAQIKLSHPMHAVKDSLTQGYNTAKRAVSTAPPNDAYLRWDAPGVEEIKPDEEAKAQQIADTMNKMQKRNFDKVCLPYPTTTSSYTNTDSRPAPPRLPRNPRQNPRPSQRHPDRPLGSPSPPLPRPLRSPRHLPHRLPLRQRARLPPTGHRTRPPRPGHQDLQRPRRPPRHPGQRTPLNPRPFVQQRPHARTDRRGHLPRNYAAA